MSLHRFLRDPCACFWRSSLRGGLLVGALSAMPTGWAAPPAAPPERVLVIRETGDTRGSPFGGLGAYLARHGYGPERVRLDRAELDSPLPTAPDTVRALLAQAPTRLVFAASLGLAQVVRRADPRVPIVFAGSADPVQLCLARSLTHPGLNATGQTGYLPVAVKMIETLRDAYPRLARWVVLIDGAKDEEDDDGETCGPDGVQAAPLPHGAPCRPGAIEHPGARDIDEARALLAYAAHERLNLVLHRICQASDLGGLAAYATPERSTGIVVPFEYLFYRNRDAVVDALKGLRLPVIYARGMFVDRGGLMALVPLQLPDERVYELVVQILRGADPGSLPIQVSSGFALWINLQAARELDLPPSLRALTRAEQLLDDIEH